MSIKKVYLELTDKCNLNCKTCYRETWKHEPIHMNKVVINKIVSQIKDIKGLEEIVLGGIGEPTLYPHIIEVINELRDYHITITTNGTLLDKNLCDTITKHVDVVVVSIDGLEINYEELRGADLKNVIKNVENIIRQRDLLNSKKPSINFQFVASTDNIDDIFGVIDLAGSTGVNKLIISNLLPQTEGNSRKILYNRYENRYMENILNKANNYSFKKGVSLILPNVELKTERRCKFIEDNAIYITSSGHVSPCYRFAHSCNEFVFNRKKEIERYDFGNLESESLINIWKGKEYERFRKSVYHNLYPSCIDCDLAVGCDMVKDAETNCYSINPSCGDCLWSRNIVVCP